MASIEEKVEYHFKRTLDTLGVEHYAKTQSVNSFIEEALSQYESKSGGEGNNYPDIKCLLDDGKGRCIPVMMEAKGGKKKLEKTDSNNAITEYTKDGTPDYKAIQGYAVNGALHYGRAILKHPQYTEVIIIGLNGTRLDETGAVADPECKAYYVAERNHGMPKHIDALKNDLTLLAPGNISQLYRILDDMSLSNEERDALVRQKEIDLEKRVKSIHQEIYDRQLGLETNQKLYLFCGLIMAGLSNDNVPSLDWKNLHSNNNSQLNDGKTILDHIEVFLCAKSCLQKKRDMILPLLKQVFTKESLWKAQNGISPLKELYKKVKEEIVPCLESDLHLDFMGKIFNSLNDWMQIENDKANDVVLTPRHVTRFMARLARTDMNSIVWDTAMGSGGFLVSAMDIMIRDAKDRIKDAEELETKIQNIKEQQLLGIELLNNIYILAVLNMILMGDGSSRIYNADSLLEETPYESSFPATVYLLNPPYSREGKGFIFVEKALSRMTTGYAAILIQENAGAGQGDGYTERILRNNTLVASIKMPTDLFIGKSSVQTAIYVFKVGRPHEADDLVKFIDMSNDGYSRQNRKKSTQEVNLKNTDHADERYDEVVHLVLGKKPQTSYYTKENGLYTEDTITLSGDDWTFAQHKEIDTIPTEADFKKTVADYLAWKVAAIMRGEVQTNE